MCSFTCTTFSSFCFFSLLPLFPSNVSQLIPSYHFHQFPNAAPLLCLLHVHSETLTTSPDFPEPEKKMRIEDHLNKNCSSILFITNFTPQRIWIVAFIFTIPDEDKIIEFN